ncbi:uncharacterized protein DFE_0957 [Desulfovibrio ferrophilus]|uniref:Uncharacterized protein n=1 Tax=Desulfovibrio ferrophilus TaxID=241368 RepID=A0A2Z6AWV8_9BACT|nr:uncharacterized protein DFE_0957 [Desulfovibrio ferrophilus]
MLRGHALSLSVHLYDLRILNLTQAHEKGQDRFEIGEPSGSWSPFWFWDEVPGRYTLGP